MTLLPLAVAASVIATLVAAWLTPLTARLAARLGVLDHPTLDPSSHKRHAAPVPYLGGVAICIALLAGASIFLTDERARAAVPSVAIPVLAVGVVLAAVGLRDDVRPLPRSLRLAAQIAAAAAAWYFGFKVEATPWPALNLLISLVWIVGITNAFNLLDNMDGLSAGLAAVSAFCFAVMGVVGDLLFVTIVASALTGACLGFLVHNRHPAKVYMGDAGSLLIGFLLALIGIRLRFDNLPQVTFLVPVVVLGIPILDTTLVLASRVRNGRPPFLGGRDHISHRLVKTGLPVGAAVGILYWSALCLGWLGLVVSRADPQIAWMLLGLVIALGLFFGFLLSKVPVYEQAAVTEANKQAGDAIGIERRVG